jgi:hypothetical protein
VGVIIDGRNLSTDVSVIPAIGPYSLDQNEIDITPYVIGGGIHDIQLTSGTIGGLIAQINATCLVKSQ